MDPVLGILGGAAIIAAALFGVTLLFRDPIRKRIESGAHFETSISTREAKLILGASKEDRTAVSSLPSSEAASPKALLTDARLMHVVPPLGPTRFETVKLPRRKPPKFYNWSYAPTGLLIMEQIPFFLQPVGDEAGRLIGHQTIDLGPADDNTATIDEIPVGVKSVSTVHFLLSAGHGFASHEGVQFLGKRIGYLEFEFAGSITQRTDLILGKNIREWAFGNHPDLVRDVDYDLTKPAWVSHDNTRRIDRMSVPVDGGPRTLERIRVVAKFEDEHLEKRMLLPAVIISAITCERTE